MRRLVHTALVSLLALAALAGALPGAAAAQGIGGPGGPRWALTEISWPTNFAPGEEKDSFVVAATNVGGEAIVSGPSADEPAGGPVKVEAELPAAVTFVSGTLTVNSEGAGTCAATGQTVACEVETGTVEAPGRAVKPGEQLIARIVVNVAKDASGVLVGTAGVEGGPVQGGAATQQARVETPVGVGPAAPGIAPGSFFSTVSTEQAGAHPNATAAFTLTTTRHSEPLEEIEPEEPEEGEEGEEPEEPEEPKPPVEQIEPLSLKSVAVETPPGLIGSAKAAPKCTFAQFSAGECPKDSQIGVETLILNTVGGGMTPGNQPFFTGGTLPLYNLTPPAGTPAEFATAILSVVIVLRAEIRTGGDYGLTVNVGPNSQGGSVIASSTMFYGDPAVANGTAGEAGAAPPRPFVYNPTACGSPLATALHVGFYQTPTSPLSSAVSTPTTWTGCDQVPFEPTLSVQPTTTVSDSPTGLAVDLHIPQSEDPEALASADLRDAAVTLPKGLAINPSAANGLTACTPAEVELHGPRPATCPDAAKIGSVEIDTPLLDHPIPGGIYVAQPGENPFGSLLAIYVAAHDPVSGVVVKLAGKIEADPVSGQLTARFDENPQLPFEDFKLDFFDGARAALTTPLPCGPQATDGTLAPWTGTAPVVARDSFAIGTAADSGACPADEGAAPNHPDFEAGTTATQAGAYAPFVLHLRRGDGSQRLRSINATLPEGLLAKLAGVPYCPDAAITAATTRSARQELATPSCPAASEIGKVTVGAGSGPEPFYLSSGRAYLAGPYKGAPLSLVIVTPALAGPYDLGTVAVRAALQVDSRTAAVSVVSDPIPTILEGIPLDLRSISVAIDRPSFTLNPTSCDPMAVGGEAISPTGAAATLSARFQAANCDKLAFKPKLKLALRGATGRSGHPALKATLTYPKQGSFANIGRAQVGLPHSLFLDQGNIGTVCDQAHLHADTCPKASIYGRAKAWTPLLDKPLEGPVYLGVGYGHKLPDLVADLNGQIRILLNGRIDTTKSHGLRSTFEAVPDAPISRFTLELKGGKKFGLIENSTNLCSKAQRASVAFTAHSGKALHAMPAIGRRCGAKKTRRG